MPEILQNKKSKRNWKVRGSIDGFEIRKYHLMPMGNGSFMLPVRAEIRKKIKKQEDDSVQVILFLDDEPLEIPEEMQICMNEEPDALDFFKSLSDSEQKFYIDWIYSAKKEDTKINRMVKTINKLLKKEKLYQINS